MESTFWLVWCQDKAKPIKKHESVIDAVEEAKRLAAKEDRVYYVLEAIKKVYRQFPPITVSDLKD